MLVFEVLDKLGKILFNTEISFPEDNNLDPEDLGYNEIIYNHNIYKYDINDRIIDQYSYNDLYAGNYLHLDYQEEDGIKTTKIIEYPLYVPGENITDIDLIENTDLFEILKDDNMINRKETVRQWEDKRHKVQEIKNELTGEERTTTDFLDDDNKVYKTTIYNYDKDGKADGHSIFLLNENGDRIDEKVFHGQPEQLVMHTVSYYSKEDGRILFSSSSFFKKLKFGDIVPQEFVSWYDYTYYD